LHSVNGGQWWQDETGNILASKDSIASPLDAQVGPIEAIEFVPNFFSDTKSRSSSHGIIAAYGGVFRTTDDNKWVRLTPLPMAYFEHLAFVELEIYAAGWLGILHWRDGSGPEGWEIQLNAALSYPIASITSYGPPDDRDVWAVGRAGLDDAGNTGSSSHGAIYHLDWKGDNHWKAVPLIGVQFEPAQTLNSIAVIDKNTVVAVGEKGLILRGRRAANGLDWQWEKMVSTTKNDLTCVFYVRQRDTLWAVGADGVILKGTNAGKNWTRFATVRSKKDNTPVLLYGVRFFDDDGWIVGKNVILNYKRLKPFVEQ